MCHSIAKVTRSGSHFDVQDPSYPVYVDTSVILGNTGEYSEEASGFEGLTYLICNPDNDFFPDLDNAPRTGVPALHAPRPGQRALHR
jgi:LL-diaminopimelate aminotransferase